MKRLVDPVHFFDSDGHSMLENQRNRARVQELEQEVARLKHLLVAQVKRNRELIADQDNITPTLN
jgi:hypothetical protein